MRTSLSNFFERFRTGLIGDAKRQPRYSDDIQLVSIVQNIVPIGGGGSGFVPGWEAPVPILREYGCMVNQASVPLEFNRIELITLATGGGVWIDTIKALSTLRTVCSVFTIAASTGLVTRVLPTAANSTAYGDGSAATAIFDSGTSALVPPANAFKISPTEDNEARPESFSGDGQTARYIGPGRVFVIQNTIGNQPLELGVQWREIP